MRYINLRLTYLLTYLPNVMSGLHQNITVSSVAHVPPFHRILWKSVE